MEYVPYTTTGNETWSFIANKAYGDPNEVKKITDANPDVPISAILPAGITLRIPINPLVNTTDTSILPIWMQK